MVLRSGAIDTGLTSEGKILSQVSQLAPWLLALAGGRDKKTKTEGEQIHGVRGIRMGHRDPKPRVVNHKDDFPSFICLLSSWILFTSAFLVWI